MRVLALVSSLDPQRGGTQSGTLGLLRAARAAGVEVDVVAPERAEARERTRAFVAPLVQAGARVRAFAPLARPAGLADRWSVSPAQVRWIVGHARRYDVVHLNGIWGVGLLAGLAVARAAGVPRVVTAHESLTVFDMDDSRSPARRRQKLALRRLYERWTTLFVLTSELEARDSLGPGLARRVIPYPLVDRHAELPSLAPRGGDAGLRMGFLGRLDPKKNLELLIDALALLPAHVGLVVAGDGPGDVRARLRARAVERGVDDRIEWLGFVDPAGRAAFLASLDLLAMPSIFESFGMSAAEGMLHGVPVLVTERTGIAEIILRRGGGRIVDPSARAVAAAVSGLDADRGALGKLGAEGQAAVREELDFEKVGAGLANAYAWAVGRRYQR